MTVLGGALMVAAALALAAAGVDMMWRLQPVDWSLEQGVLDGVVLAAAGAVTQGVLIVMGVA